MSQSTRIEPTVGRVVLYFPSDDDVYYGRIEGEKGKALSAMIAWVNDDGTINLAVNSRYGNHVGCRNVELIQPGEPTPERTKSRSYATWMPYQLGQAAKTEKLEGEIASLRDTGGGFDQRLTSYGDLGSKARESVVNRHLFPDKPAIG